MKPDAVWCGAVRFSAIMNDASEMGHCTHVTMDKHLIDIVKLMDLFTFVQNCIRIGIK